MRCITPGLLALTWAAAWAGNNNLQFGSPQQWVKPTQLPSAGADTQAAVKVLLLDYQVELTPRTIRYYIESATHIQTPQGLTAAGNITIVWNPDTDVVTVHKVQILRGKQVIDVLGAGQTFTIARRETNLDYETLDDTLTAILQPAGLQVGDTVDIAYTLERTDRIVTGSLSAQVEIPPELAVSRLHVSAQWRVSDPVQWRATDGLTGVQETHGDGTTGVALTMSDVQPILQPKNAPPRSLVRRRLEFSGLKSWSQVALLFAPLYERAAKLQARSPLQAQIASIRAATPDPKKRAALALALVEDQVRYLLLAMNNGGLVPATADETWSRRYGDCKAKTVLLLALLHGLGIEARPVAVSALAGDGLDQRLPSIAAFDHVLVQATIDGQTYWMDGTRLGERSLDLLQVPYFHWGLPLVRRSAGLVQMVPAPLSAPSLETMISMDTSAGVSQPAPFHAEVAFHGYMAVLMKQSFGNASPAQLDAGLRSIWSKQFSFVTVKSVAAVYDDKSEVERATMDGTAQMDWGADEYAPPDLTLGYVADFARQAGPHQDAPFAVAYPGYNAITVTIKLPIEGRGFSITGGDIAKTLAGVEYRRQARIDDGVFTAVASARSVQPEFPASEASADQKALLELSKSTLELHSPAGHTPTEAEIAWGLPSSNGDVADYVDSGYMLYEHREYDAAIADYNAALVRDTRNALGLGDRGLLYLAMGDNSRAQADFDAALAADPQAWVALNGRGLLAADKSDDAGAIAAFSAAIRSNPKDEFALPYRALAYWRTGRKDLALADYSEAIRQKPSVIQLYWARALLLQQQGKTSEAIHQAQLVTAANPKSALAYLTAGAIYTSVHEPAQASAAFDQAVAVEPVEQTYLMRAAYRPWTDLAGKRADIGSALKLDPKSDRALVMLAEVQMAAGQYTEAITALTDAIGTAKVGPEVLTLRGIAYEKAGRNTLAQADFAESLQHAKYYAVGLNNLCWDLATAGVSLDSALADCKAAVAKRPQQAHFQDSLGFVLLRLHRYPDAIAAYNAALKLDPLEASSLYGRGICELRTGRENQGHADIREATELSFSLADQFTHYGVSP